MAAFRHAPTCSQYSCFISYSTKDHQFAERLYADLQAKGVRCWFAPHQVSGGKKLHAAEAGELADRLADAESVKVGSGRRRYDGEPEDEEEAAQ